MRVCVWLYYGLRSSTVLLLQWHVLDEFQRKERDGGMHRTSGFNSLPAFAGWSGSPESGSDVGSSTSGHCVDY